MLNTTLRHLECPRCAEPGSELTLVARKKGGALSSGVFEVASGHIQCLGCGSDFPILAGVAILVDDVGAYLSSHVKGLVEIVADEEIPEAFREEYLDARASIESDHIEEDLEAERVNALYLLNHYVRVSLAPDWWKPESGKGSPLLDSLIRAHWDQGPFAKIAEWVGETFSKPVAAVELGCGVGGLLSVLNPLASTYLGVDGSFASIALARHLGLGMPYPKPLAFPSDLLQGQVSRPLEIPVPNTFDGRADFIVGDLENAPLKHGQWDLTLALNAIDMLQVPSVLPELQSLLLKEGGVAIQTGPYIWHEAIARELRSELPATIRDSARAVEWLYERQGFTIEKSQDHLPWLFYKHLRQLEIYSVHLLMGRRMSGLPVVGCS